MKSVFRAAACVLAAAAFAAADQVEYTGYYFRDNGHNTVATTAFSLAKTVYRRTMVLLDVELDQTTVPPLDAVTGASRPHRQIASDFKKNRGQLIGGLEQGLGDNTRVAGNYYFSHEVDYESQSVIGSFTQDLLQKNVTVALKGQYTWDQVGEITPTGQLINRFKETHQGSLTVTQLLSPSAILRVGFDGMRNAGFLSDPYRSIRLNVNGVDTIVPENHPTLRFRGAGWAEISQYLRGLDASIIFNYRYYQDDWGVKSHTGQFKLNKYVTPNWVLTPEYRYYTQSAATFGDYGSAAGLGGYHTGDYKLRAFTSHNIGAGLTCYLRAFSRGRRNLEFLTNTSLSAAYFHYFNDAASITSIDTEIVPDRNQPNFGADVLEARLKFEF